MPERKSRDDSSARGFESPTGTILERPHIANIVHTSSFDTPFCKGELCYEKVWLFSRTGNRIVYSPSAAKARPAVNLEEHLSYIFNYIMLFVPSFLFVVLCFSSNTCILRKEVYKCVKER